MIDKTIEIKNTGRKGLGVIALRLMKIGEIVVCGKPISIASRRTNHSFQIDFDKHVELDKPARIINHSCEPNLGIKNNEFGGYNFIAIRDIHPGEELTWDYCTTEYVSIAIRGVCHCGSLICRGKITGYSLLSEKVKRRYGNYIANYLK